MSSTRRKTNLALLTGLMLVAACDQNGKERTGPEDDVASPETETATSYVDVTVGELLEMMSHQEFVLVNVHIPFEGDIPGTDESIRFDEISENLDLLPAGKNSTIVLYCRSGRMSAEAATTLATLGYTNVFNLLGGFRAWEAEGHDIERRAGS